MRREGGLEIASFYFFTFYNGIVPMGSFSWEIQVAFPGKSQLRQIRATQPTVHAGYFSVSIFHRTLNMDYRSFNVRTDVNVCDCTRGCTDIVKESAPKVDSGRKIPCHTGESNLRQRRAGLMLYRVSYTPAQL